MYIHIVLYPQSILKCNPFSCLCIGVLAVYVQCRCLYWSLVFAFDLTFTLVLAKTRAILGLNQWCFSWYIWCRYWWPGRNLMGQKNNFYCAVSAKTYTWQDIFCCVPIEKRKVSKNMRWNERTALHVKMPSYGFNNMEVRNFVYFLTAFLSIIKNSIESSGLLNYGVNLDVAILPH